MAALRKLKPRLGDERFLLETIAEADVEAMARKQGWNGEEGVREFCEPDEAATCSVYTTLDLATEAAKTWLATGSSFYGCAIIDRQVYEEPHDDRGNLVRVPPQWERHETYEVAMDGECITVER